VIRAYNKGVIYISQLDLDLSHALLAVSITLGAVFIICLELDQRKPRPHA
jgi:hypothetical protein